MVYISEGRQRNYKPLSDEHKCALAVGRNKFWNTVSDEWVECRSSKRNRKKYIVVTSDTMIIDRIDNLSEFAKINSANISTLTSIASGKHIHPCKGFYCFLDLGQTDSEIIECVDKLVKQQIARKMSHREKCKVRNKKRNPNAKQRFFRKAGKVYEVTNGLPEFSKKYGLPVYAAYKLINKDINCYQGWEHIEKSNTGNQGRS